MQCRDDSFMTMAICSDFYNETIFILLIT